MVRAARRQTPYAYQGVPRDGTPENLDQMELSLSAESLRKKEGLFTIWDPRNIILVSFCWLAKSIGPPEEHLMYAPEVTRLIIPDKRPVCPPKVFNGQLYTFLWLFFRVSMIACKKDASAAFLMMFGGLRSRCDSLWKPRGSVTSLYSQGIPLEFMKFWRQDTFWTPCKAIKDRCNFRGTPCKAVKDPCNFRGITRRAVKDPCKACGSYSGPL